MTTLQSCSNSLIGKKFDPNEEIATIQLSSARVFGPDKITDKEIRLLTLKEPREHCKPAGDGWGEFKNVDVDSALVGLVVGSLADCTGVCVYDGTLWEGGGYGREGW